MMERAPGSIRIVTFNVAKNYMYLDTILENLKSSTDILFVQEPPWQLIRHAPSASSREGEAVVGAPQHPSWMTMVRNPGNDPDQRPRTLAYVSTRLAPLRPSLRRDLIDHRDLMPVSLFVEERTINLLNVYSDDQHTAINLLAQRADDLPEFDYIGGDFNCHSREWDPRVPHHRTTAILLLETAAKLGTELAHVVNPGPTFKPRDRSKRPSVIDLVFVPPAATLSAQCRREVSLQGESDHIPLSTTLDLGTDVPVLKRRTLKQDSDEEEGFVGQITFELGLQAGRVLDTAEDVEAMAQTIADIFSDAWLAFSEEVTITSRSKSWWTKECTAALKRYKTSKLPGDWTEFRRTAKAAKRKFFDRRIEEIAESNKRPWDLMEWVKQRKLPPCEAIQHKGKPCHQMSDLWDALHETYNAANDRECDLSVLDPLPALPEREWAQFSYNELQDALSACSSRSAPGPDRVTWRHLKQIIAQQDCAEAVLRLANACIRVGHWPKHFKESLSVIIPKPGKPSYSAPKAFRPIVLLNTLGKLVEKMISNRLQFDMVAFDLVHPNQMGGVRQRSTEDAGLFLTHLVRAGWAKGLQTSVIAFDIAQFFPSLNHDVLMAILNKQGFPPCVGSFFASYLVGRSTSYTWNSFISDPRQADVGVGQGSALSPVLSALYIAPIMKLYELRANQLGTTLLSYVDDGTVVTQSKSLDDNNAVLKQAYAILFALFTALGLVLEHDKTELFHFSRSKGDYNPSLDLGFAPFTGERRLVPKTIWRYLGFFFDRKLLFREHARFYCTKALTTVQSMGMLGNSTRGLTPLNKRLLYRSCVLPIATYGYRLWFYPGAKNKGVLASFTSMQRKAALWITGAFRTSPTGGVEAIAGLQPIHLHLRKLAERANYRIATLSDTHPIRSLLDEGNRKGASLHPLAIGLMSDALRQKTRGTVMEILQRLPELTEVFEPCAPEARPGQRLLDFYRDRVLFDHFEEGKHGGDEALALRKVHLGTILARAKDNPHSEVYAATDASLPQNPRHQAVAAALIFRGGAEVAQIRHVAGRVTAPDAELYAIRIAVGRAVQEPSCTRITIFTDSMVSAKRAVDPSLHSGQGHSLTVCRNLSQWLADDEERVIEFIQVPSKAKWDIHQRAHGFARSLPPVAGLNPATSLDSVRKRTTQSCLDSWITRFQYPEYRGRQFLVLKDMKGRVLQPSYAKGGTWLSSIGRNNALTARMTRCILGHAPIGAYYQRFNIPEDIECTCGSPTQTRTHILSHCRDMQYDEHGTPTRVGQLRHFLEANPTAFAFRKSPDVDPG